MPPSEAISRSDPIMVPVTPSYVLTEIAVASLHILKMSIFDRSVTNKKRNSKFNVFNFFTDNTITLVRGVCVNRRK